VTTIAASCGGGGTLSVDGAFALANTVSIDLRGADPSAAIAVLHIGAPTAPATCGSCAIIAPFIALPVAFSGGNASVPLSIQCAPSFVGIAFCLQYAIAFGT
jgi:hypothetical protein